MNSQYVILMEMIGTIAFALAGAVKAVQYELDVFGVVIIGVTTATGGGIFRDLVLGKTPPTAFTNSEYVLTAAIVSVLVFIVLYIYKGSFDANDQDTPHYFETVLLVADALGLGIFTAMGVNTAWMACSGKNFFLCVFSGVITGVGGGLARDVMLSCMPSIFTKEIYAMACVVGAVVEMLMFRSYHFILGPWVSTGVVMLVRITAARMHVNLPKISKFRD